MIISHDNLAKNPDLVLSSSTISAKPKSSSENMIIPNVYGNNKIEKHFSDNVDVLDLNKPNDIYADNLEQEVIDFDYEHASINISNRELTPKCSVANVSCSIEIEDSTNKIYSIHDDIITLPEGKPEKIINCGNEAVFSFKESVLDRETQYDIIEISPKSSNKIGSVCDCFIVNTDDHDNYEMESFDNINISKKDFNLASESSTKSIKNLVGKIRDINSEFNFPSYTFTPHLDENEKLILSRRIGYEGDRESITKEKSLVITFDDILIKKFNENDADYINKDFAGDSGFSLLDKRDFSAFIPAGIHKVGVVKYLENDDEIATYTKFSNNIDFLMNGESEYLYKNLNRPVIVKKNRNFICPMVSQSYRFDKDYVLNSIQPNFIFPTNLSKEQVKNLKIIVTYGFLINGKIKESGVVHTDILSYEYFKTNKKRIDVYPLWIPRNTDFFVGFTVATNGSIDFENVKDVTMKCVENGEYDKSGNLISFPSDVKTKMFIKEQSYENKMLKVDLFVNTYEVNNSTLKYKSLSFNGTNSSEQIPQSNEKRINLVINRRQFITFQNPTTDYELDRVIFLNSDIIPNDVNAEYYIVDMSNIDNTYGTINSNNEYIAKDRLSNYKYQIRISTNNKYVSPIIRYKLHNYLTKKYYGEGELSCWSIGTNMNVKLSSPIEPSSFAFRPINSLNLNLSGIDKALSYFSPKSSYVDIRLKNLKGTYTANTSDEMFGSNELIKGNIKGNEFLIRLNFDYWLNDFSDNGISNSNEIYVELTAVNKITGIQYKKCKTNNYFYKRNNVLGNNIDGCTIDDKSLKNGWKNKTYEFVPLIPFKENNVNKYIPIVKIEDWEFIVRLWLPEHGVNQNPLVIRNVKVSVDTLQYTLESN